MLNKIRKLKNKKGFTLVELIVVIAIIAILTAVIVPLVGRYSAQATYTTLQDAAATISSSANTAMSSATMMGSVCKSTSFKGSKVNGSLTVTSSESGITSGAVTANALATVASADSVDTKACKNLANALVATLPNNAYFFVTVSSNAVTGVIYTTDATLGNSLAAGTTATRVEGFEQAYQSGTTAVGVSGKYIPGT